MDLNSSLYFSKVFHERKKPKRNSFFYKIFMFMLDLDELNTLPRKFFLFGYNRFNVFSFYDKDHFKEPSDQDSASMLREKLHSYLHQNGIRLVPSKVKLLTHLRIFGYVFNPVSFYYCYDENDLLYCVVAEVSNTYGEMKMYLVENIEKNYFKQEHHKLFYISPFTNLDDKLLLKIGIPGDKLNIFIDTFENKEVKVKTSLTGKKVPITNFRLMKYVLRFPLITIQIISLIHWQALKLWMKGVKHTPKDKNLHLQKDIYYSKKIPKNDQFTLPENCPQTAR